MTNPQSGDIVRKITTGILGMVKSANPWHDTYVVKFEGSDVETECKDHEIEIAAPALREYDFDTACTQMHEHDPDTCAPEDYDRGLSVKWSPDFDAYASGQMDISAVRCALCGNAPCDCPEFGTPEYFALIDRRHGRS
ncbi:hypothetical protein [Actinoallomurus iriomotensis]|uniref:Uncharacterized protein n=1 Tax=Actinoallomurus iriomotensis TaxID=478107 RepID=A0A9W6RXR8_9ACTN|nr:hypothetical protein [Actinoallomurus iriomotensis]GLY82052.1 hypothetical protein Airi01_103190 [Actinoallomurus iriomotensis]